MDGTNTYVIANPGSGAGVVVDPGPDDPAHRARVDAALARRDLACELVLVTHHHNDHSEAAQGWATAFGCQVAAPTREIAGDAGRVLADGETLTIGGLRIDVVSTPGHCHDHTAFQLENRVVLSGDHVLGRGTAVVAYPDGDVVSYLDSLRKTLDLGAAALYPGHGPEMTENPNAVVQFYLDHRAYREQQVLDVLADGPLDPAAIVRVVYAEVGQHLWRAAEMSTRAGLRKLVNEGRVIETDGKFALVT